MVQSTSLHQVWLRCCDPCCCWRQTVRRGAAWQFYPGTNTLQALLTPPLICTRGGGYPLKRVYIMFGPLPLLLWLIIVELGPVESATMDGCHTGILHSTLQVVTQLRSIHTFYLVKRPGHGFPLTMQARVCSTCNLSAHREHASP